MPTGLQIGFVWGVCSRVRLMGRAWDPTSFFSMFLNVLHSFFGLLNFRFCIFLVFVIIFLFFYFLVKDQAVGASPAGFPQLPLEGSPPPTQGLHLGKRPSTTQCHRLKPRQGAQTCPGRHRCAQTMQPWAALPHQPYRKHAYGLGGWGEGA